MIESFFVQPGVCARLREGSAGPLVEALATRLAEEGYSRTHGRRELRGAARFGRWLVEHDVALEHADQAVAARYLEDFERRPNGRWPQAARGVLRLVEFLRDHDLVRKCPAAPSDGAVCLSEFALHLERVIGLASGTRANYIRVARRLLEGREGTALPGWQGLKPEEIADFVKREVSAADGQPQKQTTTATRAFLRFLIFRGEIGSGLLAAVPPVREWKLASLPRFLSSDHVALVLESVAETSAVGVRDKAILLLLSGLGLRAGEVARLDLEDIDWREGRVLIRAGKSRRERCLPLPQDVGAAIVRYLKGARPRGASSRAVFLRCPLPRRRLTSSAVTKVATRYLERAGIKVGRLGAHTFRHTVATQMLRGGASFKEVADVLGHQHLGTTQVYAKLDLPSLGQVALAWPGGAQ